MHNTGQLFRYTAFSADPAGGNPAGVWIGDTLPTDATMQQLAADVGYSETAFVAPANGFERTIRYFSPAMEVPFCGHATIATGVVLGGLSGAGVYQLTTQAGVVPVAVTQQNGQARAALTSVTPQHKAADRGLVNAILATLGWEIASLDPAIPPAMAYGGAWHLVLAVQTRERLAQLDYDFEQLKGLMLAHDLVTLQLIWRESAEIFHARNPFPVGGVVEDPATGAAAAALGGYLRDAGLMQAPATFTIHQGEDMGRPSLLTVELPTSGGIIVSGAAVAITTT